MVCLALGPVQMAGLALAEGGACCWPAPVSGLLTQQALSAHMLYFWLPRDGVQPLPSSQASFAPNLC